MEQTVEKSDTENDDELGGHESPLPEIGSGGEDGEEQVLLATADNPVYEKNGADLH